MLALFGLVWTSPFEHAAFGGVIVYRRQKENPVPSRIKPIGLHC